MGCLFACFNFKCFKKVILSDDQPYIYSITHQTYYNFAASFSCGIEKMMVIRKRVIDYIKPCMPYMALTVIVKFVGTIAELMLPYMLSYMIDDIAPTENVPFMFVFGGLMVLAALVVFTANISANRMALKTSSKITLAVRHDLFDRTLHLSCEQLDRITAPTLVSRLTSDTYNINMMLISVQRIGVRAPILVIGGMIVTFMLDRVLSLVLISLVPITFIIIFFISRRGVKLYTDVQRSADKLVLGMQENLNGIRVIKALSKTEYENEKFDGINYELMSTDIKAGSNNALSSPLLQMFLNFGLIGVIIVGAYRVDFGLTQTGTIIAFLSYFTIILNALMMLNRVFMQLSKGIASSKRVDEILLEDTTDISELFVPSEEEKGIPENAHDARIVFDNVCFSYLKVKNNLNGISFSLKAGETLGVIGATGSGKTTLVSLLLRFYNPDSGRIFIEGRDIRSIPPKELYAKIGVALQSDFLMADTIRENIDFGRSLSDEQIEKGTENAMAAAFIREKADGYAEQLNVNGANVSGGQKQRILISRALAGDPEILILDDSSGGLDYKTDAQLRSNLAKGYREASKVIVAQRVSSVKNADIIIVLDEGNVIGIGTHDRLMESCEEYRHIAVTQMGREGSEIQTK